MPHIRLGLDHDSAILELPEGREVNLDNSAEGMDLLVRYLIWYQDTKPTVRPSGRLPPSTRPADATPRRFTAKGRVTVTLEDLGLA